MPFYLDIYNREVLATNSEYETIAILLSEDIDSFVVDTAIKGISAALLPTTIYQNASGNWQSTYLTVSALSASWEDIADIIPTVTNYLSTNSVTISAFTITNTLSNLNSLTISGIISGNNLRTSFNQGSATGILSFAVNTGRAFGSRSFAEGFETIASNIGSHAEGNQTIASGVYSHAQGSNTEASGLASHAQGSRTRAVGDYTFTGGRRAVAKDDYSYVWATETGTNEISSTRTGQYLISASGGVFIPGNIGIGTDNNINALTIVGNISGNNLRTSFNLGSATGDYSFAEGFGSKAFGDYAHAEGYETIASSTNNHAEGFRTTASGNTSHAEGALSIASGSVSHAEGSNTIASGSVSHAEGSSTRASGSVSHAAGFKATAAQDYTYAWSDGNLGTTTSNLSTTRAGQYMVNASGGIYLSGQVGIGTDSIDNALTVVGTISTSGHGASPQWYSTFLTVSSLSGSWGGGSQTLSFNEGTQQLSISNGNTVALSSLAVSSVNIPTILQYLSSNNISLSGVTLSPVATLSSTRFITSRVLQDKLGEVISVKDFGAKGDGVSDDWLSIQRALSAAAGIARVFIPGGLYFIKEELKIPSNSYIYGAGIGTTIIKLSSIANATQCVMTNSQNTRSVATNQGNENIVIKDLELDGNVSRFPGSYSPVGDTSGTGLCLANVHNAFIERVSVHDTCRHCIDICAPETSITFNPSDYVANPSYNIHLKDIVAYGAGDDNITTHFSHSIIIENAYVPYTGGTEVPTNSNGIEIDDGSYDITIIGGYIKNCRRGLEIKGHSWAPAAKRVKVYGLTVENCVRNFGIRHLGFDNTDSKTAFDIALYDCTSIAPLSSTFTTDGPRSLQISNYDGVFVKDFKVVGEHNATRAVTIQERARNVNFDGITFTQISGGITGITDAMLYIDSTADRNIVVRNAYFRDCIGLPIAAVGSVPGVIIDGVDARTSLSANTPARVIDFSWSPLDVPYIIRNITMSGYTSAYQLGGTHDFDFPTTIDVGRITNIIPSSPATADTQYTVARFGWREGTGQGLNIGLGTRIEFTGSVVSGVSANSDIPVAYISTRKVNATDSDVTSNLTFGTLSANNSTAVDRLTITPTGLVGVNTTTPNERVTVVGNISSTGIVYAQSVGPIGLSAVQQTFVTLTLNEVSELLTVNNAVSSVIIIPPDSTTNFVNGSQVNISRIGAGTVTVSASPGVFLRSADNKKELRVQNSTATVVKLSANDWLLFGDIV